MRKIFAITIIGCVVLFSRCKSSRVDESILEYQKQIDELTAELKRRDTAIRNGIVAISSVSDRCREMGDEVEDIIRLFDEYQQTVERLLREYQQARNGAEAQAADIEYTNTATGN